MDVASLRELWSGLWTARFADATPRLRFELGGEALDAIPRFMQAHRRASTIADAVLAGTCVALVAWSGFPPNPIGMSDDVDDGFAALHATGFHAPQIAAWKENLYPDPEEEADSWEVRAYALGTDTLLRDTLLWHAIAADMPIYPKAPLRTFLLDPAAAVLLHAYDDRGMDVIAGDVERLRGFHTAFADWLLDEDRARMAALF